MSTRPPTLTRSASGARSASARREMVVAVLVDIAIPLVVYYTSREAGASQWLALVLSAVAPMARAAYTLVRKRRADWFAIVALAIILISVVTSFLTGGPRFLLAKDGLLTATVGIVILVTLRAKRPIMFVVGRAMLEQAGESAGDWDRRWQSSARFRRTWRVLTVIWGVGVLLDAAIRVLAAYTLPIDVVPALSGFQWIVLLVVLQVISQLYLRRPAVKALVFD